MALALTTRIYLNKRMGRPSVSCDGHWAVPSEVEEWVVYDRSGNPTKERSCELNEVSPTKKAVIYIVCNVHAVVNLKHDYCDDDDCVMALQMGV
jgi:hypothetical protein